MPKDSSAKRVLIWGIPMVDWLAIADSQEQSSHLFHERLAEPVPKVHLHAQNGGYALLKELLTKMLPEDNAKIHCNMIPFEAIEKKSSQEPLENPIDRPFNHQFTRTWTQWKQFYKSRKKADQKYYTHDERCYRLSSWIDRETLNLEENNPGSGTDKTFNINQVIISKDTIPEECFTANPLAQNVELGCDLLLLDDRGWTVSKWINLEKPDREEKLQSIPLFAKNTEKIILKLSPQHPFETPLVYQICKSKLADRTTLLITLDELRSFSQSVSIGVSLSWEQMFSDVTHAVKEWLDAEQNGYQKDHDEFPAWERVVVTIGLCGVVIVEPKRTGEWRSALVFDRTSQEGDFEREHEGRALGYNTCMMAALGAACVLIGSDQPHFSWSMAARIGLRMMRQLHKDGYLQKGAKRPVLTFPFENLVDTYLRYPKPLTQITQVAKEIQDFEKAKQHGSTYASELSIHPHSGDTMSISAMAIGKDYSILEQYLQSRSAELPTASDKEPEKFIGLFSDSASSEQNASPDSVLEHVRPIQDSAKTAADHRRTRETRFSVAKNIVTYSPAKALAHVPIERVNNWSSADRREIEGVRSVYNAIRGYISTSTSDSNPLSIAVFGPPGSGKSFAVKQIAESLGLHKDAQLTFNLSQYESPRELARAFHAIRDLNLQGFTPLVFWDEFDSKCAGEALGWLRYFLVPMQDGQFFEAGVIHPVGKGIYVFAGGTCATYEQFVDSDADVALKKPDFISRLQAYINVKGPNGEPNTSEDNSFMIRRAFLLRSQLEHHAKHLIEKDKGKIDIDPAALEAFIRAAFYKHGARSMEALIRSSALADKTKFDVSSLPPDHLLAMHVEKENFTDYTRRDCKGRLRVAFYPSSRVSEMSDEVQRQGIMSNLFTSNVEFTLSKLLQYFPKLGLTVLVPLCCLDDLKLLEVLEQHLMPKKTDHQPHFTPRIVLICPSPRRDIFKLFKTYQYPKTMKALQEHYAIDFWLSRADELIELPSAPSIPLARDKVYDFLKEHADISWAVKNKVS